jgi:hypothetical protein
MYFQEDLEAFLAKASVQQLRTYVVHYAPVILASIRAATAKAFRATDSHQPPVSRLGSHPRNIHHPALEEVPYRKRNRLRIISLVARWLASVRRRAIAEPPQPHPT